MRHRAGADVRLSRCADASRRTAYYHYGSVGGAKPEAALQRWLHLSRHGQCYARLVPHFVADGTVLRRTLGWLRRTRAELGALLQPPRGSTRASAHPSSSASAPLQACATAIDAGLRCLAQSAARAGTISLPDSDCYSSPRGCSEKVLPTDKVLAAIDDD